MAKPIEIRTYNMSEIQMNPVFGCRVFRWLLYLCQRFLGLIILHDPLDHDVEPGLPDFLPDLGILHQDCFAEAKFFVLQSYRYVLFNL